MTYPHDSCTGSVPKLTVYIYMEQNLSIDNLAIARGGLGLISRLWSVVLLLMSMRHLILLSKVRPVNVRLLLEADLFSQQTTAPILLTAMSLTRWLILSSRGGLAVLRQKGCGS